MLTTTTNQHDSLSSPIQKPFFYRVEGCHLSCDHSLAKRFFLVPKVCRVERSSNCCTLWHQSLTRKLICSVYFFLYIYQVVKVEKCSKSVSISDVRIELLLTALYKFYETFYSFKCFLNYIMFFLYIVDIQNIVLCY